VPVINIKKIKSAVEVVSRDLEDGEGVEDTEGLGNRDSIVPLIGVT
jgi:hypothetical protein